MAYQSRVYFSSLSPIDLVCENEAQLLQATTKDVEPARPGLLVMEPFKLNTIENDQLTVVCNPNNKLSIVDLTTGPRTAATETRV